MDRPVIGSLGDAKASSQPPPVLLVSLRQRLPRGLRNDRTPATATVRVSGAIDMGVVCAGISGESWLHHFTTYFAGRGYWQWPLRRCLGDARG